jgi:hypothetical protein
MRSMAASFVRSGKGLEKYSALDIAWTQGRNKPPMVKHPADSVHSYRAALPSCIRLAFAQLCEKIKPD